MAGKIYIGVSNIATSPKKIYAGVNGIAKEIKAIYVGDSNGIARKVFPNSLIPDIYQRVEYIQSAAGFDAQGYIETNYQPNNYTRIVAKYSDQGPIGQGISVFSYLQEAQPSQSIEYYHFGFGSTVLPNNQYNAILSPTMSFGSAHNSSYFSADWYRYGGNYNLPYVYDLNNHGNMIFDNISLTSSNIVNFYQSNSTIVIFGRKIVNTNNEVTLMDYNFGIKRLYYFKIYNNYDTLVRNFYPCYRKSDRTPGLYEIISGTFYTNAVAGGIFPVGNDVNTEDDITTQ